MNKSAKKKKIWNTVQNKIVRKAKIEKIKRLEGKRKKLKN